MDYFSIIYVFRFKCTDNMNFIRISTDSFDLGIYNVVFIFENEVFSTRVLII